MSTPPVFAGFSAFAVFAQRLVCDPFYSYIAEKPYHANRVFHSLTAVFPGLDDIVRHPVGSVDCRVDCRDGADFRGSALFGIQRATSWFP